MRVHRPILAAPAMLPRALAVLSCAIALLAAQPASAHPQNSPRQRPAIILSLDHASLPAKSESRSHENSSPSTSRPANFFASARSFRILATMDIFHRLLLAELRLPASESTLLPAIILEPVAIALLNPPLLLASPHQIFDEQTSRTPPPERQFALLHCLLAPPIA